jgi:hypothetical protein
MMSAQGVGQAGAFAPDAEKASLSTRSIFAVMVLFFVTFSNPYIALRQFQ